MRINLSNEFLRADLNFNNITQVRLLFSCLAISYDDFYENYANIDYEFEINRYTVQKILNANIRNSIFTADAKGIISNMATSGFLVREKRSNKASAVCVFDTFSYEKTGEGKKTSHVFKYRFASTFANKHFFVREKYVECGKFPDGISGYAEVDTEIIGSLKSVCACAIYLKAITTINDGMNACSVNINSIKDNLNYQGEYRYFKRDVIKGLQQTLLKFNLNLDFKEIKNGKKVSRIEFKIDRIIAEVKTVKSSKLYNNEKFVQNIAKKMTELLSQDSRYSDVVCSYAQAKSLLIKADGDANIVKDAFITTLTKTEKKENVFGYMMGVINNIVNPNSKSENMLVSLRDKLNTQEQKIYDYVLEAYSNVTSEDISRIRLLYKKFYPSTIKKAIQVCCIEHKERGFKYVQEQLLLGAFGKEKLSKKKQKTA